MSFTIRVRALGRDWTVSPETVGAVLAFRDYVAQRVGDPFEGLDALMKHLDRADALGLIKEARETARQLRCFSLQTPLARAYLHTEEGVAEYYRQLLLPHHPDVTPDEALQVAKAHGEMAAAEEKRKGKKPGAPAPAASGQADALCERKRAAPWGNPPAPAA